MVKKKCMLCIYIIRVMPDALWDKCSCTLHIMANAEGHSECRIIPYIQTGTPCIIFISYTAEIVIEVWRYSIGTLSMLNTVRVCRGSISMCRNRLFRGKDVNICSPLWAGTPSVVCWITGSLCVQHSHRIKGWSMWKQYLGIGCWGSVGLTVFILTSFCWAVCCCLATSHFFLQRDVFCECADTMLNVAEMQWLS